MSSEIIRHDAVVLFDVLKMFTVQFTVILDH